MALESTTYINGLVATNPTGTDARSQGDDHIRMVKSAVKATFPNITGAVTPTHTELNYVNGVTSALQTQMDTKAPLASPTFTGTPAAPTAATDTNTTQVATTAFVQAAMTAATINNLVYPVGSIYMNAAVATNPATLLGFGTWAAYAEGRVPVGKASSGTFDTLNATGGAETDSHTLTLSEIPAHTHDTNINSGSSTDGNPNIASGGGDTGNITTGSAGGGAAHTHDILQPYIVVYMWKRTA